MNDMTIYRFHFSGAGYARVRNIGFAYKRPMSNIIRLLMVTMLREEHPTFTDANYDEVYLTRELALALDTTAVNRMVSRATNRGIPAECIGEWISNYQVQA